MLPLLHRIRMFQSHAGSIEAMLLLPPGARFFEFQSHAGSIEARAIAAADSDPCSRFNPTLVRLRRRPSSASTPNGRSVSIPRWFD